MSNNSLPHFTKQPPSNIYAVKKEQIKISYEVNCNNCSGKVSTF